MDKLRGFLPDSDPTGPGVITDCTNLIGSTSGMVAAPTPATPASTPVLAAECRNGVVTTLLDDTRRIFAGTQTKLYELVAGAWVDQTRVASVYNGGAETRWSFAQYGNATLAANLADKIQRSVSSGVFADIASAPQAKIIFGVRGFVMALNTVDGTYGTSPDRWWCSAAFDETSWTPSVSTLANTGRLVATGGQITAGGRLGEYAVAYKEKAIYVGQFVGAPDVWDWIQVPGGEYGCIGQDAWCDIGGAHFVIGLDSLFLFDGSRPTPVGIGECRQWFFDNSSPSYRYKTKCVFDKQNGYIWIFYPSTSSTTCNKALVYHLPTKMWGTVNVDVEAALSYVTAGATIDTMPNYSATIDGLAGVSFDSQFWLAGGRSCGIFNTSHQLQSMTGPAVTSSLTTGDGGDDDVYSLLTKIRLRFAPGAAPTSATVQTLTKANSGDTYTVASTATMTDGKFDVLDSARWHKAVFTFTGPHTVSAVGATLVPEGNV